MKITNGAGVLLVAGEAFAWKPWNAARITVEGKNDAGMGTKRLVNDRGGFEVGPEAWGVLGLVWPKPGELASSFAFWNCDFLPPREIGWRQL